MMNCVRSYFGICICLTFVLSLDSCRIAKYTILTLRTGLYLIFYVESESEVRPQGSVTYFSTEKVNGEIYKKSPDHSLDYVGGYIKFYLHTRYLNKQFNFTNVADLKDDFCPERVTKILLHGWQNNYNSIPNRILTKSYLDLYDANVIVVDWSEFALCNDYGIAVDNVAHVGKALALFLDELNQKLGSLQSRTHMIGFSIGAHVAGVAGSLSKFKIYRITGLDPAGPGFCKDSQFQLKYHSAMLVDVIHTGAYACGTRRNMGLADFYPNAGITSLDVVKSHQKAYEFFNESILRPGGFLAKRCDNWWQFVMDDCNYDQIDEMGEHISEEARGEFYLQTNDDPPYARYNLSLIFLWDKRVPIPLGKLWIIFIIISTAFSTTVLCLVYYCLRKNDISRRNMENSEHQRLIN